jgi:hypothetical protein
VAHLRAATGGLPYSARRINLLWSDLDSPLGLGEEVFHHTHEPSHALT